MNEKDQRNNFIEDLLVILVIHKMKIDESPAYKSISQALPLQSLPVSLFIYDNSPNPQLYSSTKNWDIDYTHDITNPGVSKAYNLGATFAKAESKKWLLLCDQDTEFPLDIFSKFQTASDDNPNVEIFAPSMRDREGIVSPFLFRQNRGIRLKKIEPGIHSLKNFKVINSGLLVSCSLFQRAGGYDERFRLDFSDLAFIERVIPYCDRFLLIDSVAKHNLNSHDSVDLALERFRVYIRSAFLYPNIAGKNFLPLINAFLRAVKFSLKFRSTKFIFVLIKEVVK